MFENIKEDKKIKHIIKLEQIDQAKWFSPVLGICALCTKANFDITFKTRVGPTKQEKLNV